MNDFEDKVPTIQNREENDVFPDSDGREEEKKKVSIL